MYQKILERISSIYWLQKSIDDLNQSAENETLPKNLPGTTDYVVDLSNELQPYCYNTVQKHYMKCENFH